MTEKEKQKAESKSFFSTVRSEKEEKPLSPARAKLHEIIFEADTTAGWSFDIALFFAIILSVLAVMLESVEQIQIKFGNILFIAEWFFTVLFTIEYVLRLICVKRPLIYATSFFGVIDLLAVIPTYLSIVIAGTQTLLVIRIFRLLRVFRVLKLSRYIGESRQLLQALKNSRPKIIVFLGAVLSVVTIMGSLMYLIEGPTNGFTSIPRGIYWAIVTMTTVGYGDLAPKTVFGQSVASVVMILGYGIIAVPTGIVTVEIARAKNEKAVSIACPGCGAQGHDQDAAHCKHCGEKL